MGTRRKGIGSHELSPESVKDYLLAGNAVLTVQNRDTENHFTYEVSKKKDAQVWFVKMLMNQEYVYIGMFTWLGFRTTKGSKVSSTSPSFMVMNIVFRRYVLSLNPHPKLRLMHNGYCAHCGRMLTHPESLETGLGPVCRGYKNNREKFK